jgi:ferric-chelate reductase
VREITYPQLTPSRSFIKIPPFGTTVLLVTYLSFIIGLEYFGVFIDGAQRYEAMGLRAALLTVAQLPLVILLAGKNNLIGHVTGVSYERLQVLHRWVARTLFLTATLHGAYQIYGWNQYDLVILESQTDSCWPTGTFRFGE